MREALKLVFFSTITYFFGVFVWVLLYVVYVKVTGAPVEEVECLPDNYWLEMSYIIEISSILVVFGFATVICFRYFYLPTGNIKRLLFGALLYFYGLVIENWLLPSCPIQFWGQILDALVLVLPPVIVGRYFDKYVEMIEMSDGGDNTSAEEEKVTAEMRRVAWRAFFTKKKASVMLYFLITCVGLPFILWDDGFDRHFRASDFSLSATIIVEFIMIIAVSWFGLLITVINAFAVFHGFKGFIPLTRVYNCIRSPFISKGWKWVCLVTIILVSLGILYSVFVLMTLL